LGPPKGKEAGLSGSLKDFGLTDLFQILGQQQKTGVLNLQEDKKGVVQILFDKGVIVGTAFPSETEEETSLGKRLIRGGLISPEDWEKVYAQHKDELISVERVLLKKEMVRNEDLKAVLRLLTFETIYGLFKWKGGAFWFETREVYYDPTIVEPLNAEYLLLDVLRMVDEWPMLAERLPNFEIVLQKVNPLATLDVLAGTPWEKKRTFQMEVIFELVNGIRTVREVIDLSFVGEFDTCKNLIELMEAGLLEPVALSIPRERKERIEVTRFLLRAGAYILVIGLGALLTFQLVTIRGKNFPLSPSEQRVWLIMQDYLSHVKKEKMANAQEVFFLEENRYPANPGEMVKKGLLPR